MSESSYLGFVAVSVAVIAVPGPSVLFAISRTVMGGRRQGLLTVLGNAGGLFAQVLLVAVGLGVLVSRSAEADAALRTLGAGYLMWLGASAIRHRDRSAGDSHDDAAAGGRASARERAFVTLRRGFVVGVSNPKSIVLLAALLPQYVDLAAGLVIAQMVLLGALFCAMAIVGDSAWVMAAAQARAWLGGSSSRLRAADVAAGLVMIALGGWLLLSG